MKNSKGPQSLDKTDAPCMLTAYECIHFDGIAGRQAMAATSTHNANLMPTSPELAVSNNAALFNYDLCPYCQVGSDIHQQHFFCLVNPDNGIIMMSSQRTLPSVVSIIVAWRGVSHPLVIRRDCVAFVRVMTLTGGHVGLPQS